MFNKHVNYKLKNKDNVCKYKQWIAEIVFLL